MSHTINLEHIDADGAVREAHADAIEGLQEGDTRLSFLRKSAVTAGVAMSGGAVLGRLHRARSQAPVAVVRPRASARATSASSTMR